MLKNKEDVKPVICLQTGDVYPSFYMAGKAAGVDRSAIMRAVRNRRPCKGRLYAYYPPQLHGCSAEAVAMWCAGKILDYANGVK